MTKNKRLSYIIAGIILCIAVFLWLGVKQNKQSNLLMATVKKGELVSKVYSTGQLQTEHSESILLPSEMSSRNIDIYEIKITNIVEEGTVVDSGGYVASLDHAAVEELRVKAEDEYETAYNDYEDARIDTSLNMSALRDELLNANVDLEEKRLILDQSVYESPAVKRQAKLDVERAERDWDQKKQNYYLKEKQDKLKIIRAYEQVRSKQQKLDDIKSLFEALEVKAPKSGMVIYSYDRMGRKIKVGSSVSRYQPRIAELPDLSSMISKTFINEIDISKVKVGQNVEVGIDAFPDKQFNGKVVSVANMGQVIPNGDAKVFEVVIKIYGTDKDLRPAMTTSNVFTTDVLNDVLYAPIESVFTNDTLNYVIIDEGGAMRKQVVKLGRSNENFVVVEGVDEGELLLMNIPNNAEDLPFEGFAISEQQKDE